MRLKGLDLFFEKFQGFGNFKQREFFEKVVKSHRVFQVKSTFQKSLLSDVESLFFDPRASCGGRRGTKIGCLHSLNPPRHDLYPDIGPIQPGIGPRAGENPPWSPGFERFLTVFRTFRRIHGPKSDSRLL